MFVHQNKQRIVTLMLNCAYASSWQVVEAGPPSKSSTNHCICSSNLGAGCDSSVSSYPDKHFPFVYTAFVRGFFSKEMHRIKNSCFLIEHVVPGFEEIVFHCCCWWPAEDIKIASTLYF